MDCARVRELLSHCENGETPAMSDVEDADFLQHLAACAECRGERRRILAGGHSPAQAVSQSDMGTEAPVEAARTRRAARLSWLVVGGVLILLVGIVIAIVPSRKAAPSVKSSPAPQKEPVVAAASTAQSATATGDSTPANSWLEAQKAFREAGLCGERASFVNVIERCRDIVRHWPESDEGLQARRLISRCYMEMGEVRLGQEAFWDYAIASGARARTSLLASGNSPEKAEKEAMLVTCREVMDEAQRLVELKDYGPALYYYAEVVRRYPGTEPALAAQEAISRHNLRVADSVAAVETLERIIKESPASPEGKRARVSLPSALFNAGRHDEAVQSWLQYAAEATADNDKACGYYNAGVTLAASGESALPEATRLLRRVIEGYPGSPYASSAKKMLQDLPGRQWNVDIDSMVLGK